MRILPLNNYQLSNNNKQKVGFKAKSSKIGISPKVIKWLYGSDASKVQNFLNKLSARFKQIEGVNLQVIRDFKDNCLVVFLMETPQHWLSKCPLIASTEAITDFIPIKLGADLEKVTEQIDSAVTRITSI